LEERIGCFSTILTVAAGGILLVVNGAMCFAAYTAFFPPTSRFEEKVAQCVYFLAPVALLALEWIAIDIVGDHTWRK
jgi:hypothetical protein